jgi:AIR synthase related protein, N-terminal domain
MISPSTTVPVDFGPVELGSLGLRGTSVGWARNNCRLHACVYIAQPVGRCEEANGVRRLPATAASPQGVDIGGTARRNFTRHYGNRYFYARFDSCCLPPPCVRFMTFTPVVAYSRYSRKAARNTIMTSFPSSPRLTSLSHGGGCGCKIAPGVLADLLKNAAPTRAFAQLLVGTETADDAAVYRLNDTQAIVATTDFFMPIVDDPFDFGRIAATNALSDVYAMGGTPSLALAIVGMPIKVLAP